MKPLKILLAVIGWMYFIGGVICETATHGIYIGLFLIFIVELIKFIENEKSKSFTEK